MFIQNFTCFSTSTFLSKNRQGNVNSFCIVQFSRSFSNSSLWFLSGDFVIISHLFEFVKRFFKLFQSFLNFLVEFSRSDFLSESLFIISHFLELVKRFFKLFSKFFELFCDFLSFRALISDGLYIISPFHAKVNTFSQKISKIYWICNINA